MQEFSFGGEVQTVVEDARPFDGGELVAEGADVAV